ncbi:MAG TPA: hypothetical protein VHH36_02445, partial [Candidatus Thermoplasmatota archaeon]|nr:hypothetical protein [Candidatus Thermoplasmatota archaeon]
RGRGHEPLLAQSVYEYSFAQQNPLQRLTYLGMARVTANLAGLPGLLGAPTPVETRFQGLPAITVPAAWVAAAFAVGLAMGAGIGLTALLPRDEEGEEPVPPQGAPPARTTISKPD